ncbi:extracellular solute-binding protein [Ponticoccus sp. SC2-23]|uniref:ABC transporter substrate-binding protein n=1 Tax=Alexandriicola marinus TaxID=2081710 RepID=UPI00193B4B6D|nr:extracellular solute-binding protein [Alexandriicola marinus]MBM1221442.1 extracellular solute-binding protein [Ponticoccus sp. SC6-9]MBM1226483.1 extracellular solute-binding protein [Ponticoccus sp. SC6-15]MBM1230434.1 extracellular solute-binding protein [Ponticoccus sp. SC6-38]MBM1234957.1 extracellular solute-binding protein [Ponticoccus sp. SC6-45]MBM1239455.1 extracellular solute-binding protein [Ponticoccus sp. SC6-49]MBM1243237.1 extracellular solute-binding protein [Ponticoccus s
MANLMRTSALVGALVWSAVPALAEDINITVWAGGSNDSDSYRIEAIEIAADILEREYSIWGEEVNITVEGRRDFTGWDEFKQGVTLGAEAGTAPSIVVTSHLDIAPWSQAGYIVAVEDYVDLDAWPLSNVYPNLMEIASYAGAQWGIPQDSESRPFFYWRETMAALGYDEDQIDALPDMVASGEYTLANVLEDATKAVEMGLVEEGYGFYPRPSNGPDYAQFYQSFGGQLVDPETGKLVLDVEAMTEFYQFFVDAVAAGVTRQNHIGTDWNQWYNEVANGRAAFWHGGTWHFGRYATEGNDDFWGTIQFSLIPAGDEDGRANTITHPLVYLVMDQEDDRIEEIAAQLVTIATEPRLNSLHAIQSNHLAVAEAQADIDLYRGNRWASEATEVLLASANAQPNHLDYGAYSEAMFRGLEAAWTGVQTPEEAVAEVEAQMRATIGDQLIVR